MSETKVPMPPLTCDATTGHCAVWTRAQLVEYGDQRAAERDALWQEKVAGLTRTDVYTLIGHANTVGGTDMPLYLHDLAAKVARAIGEDQMAERCKQLLDALATPCAGLNGDAL